MLWCKLEDPRPKRDGSRSSEESSGSESRTSSEESLFQCPGRRLDAARSSPKTRAPDRAPRDGEVLGRPERGGAGGRPMATSFEQDKLEDMAETIAKAQGGHLKVLAYLNQIVLRVGDQTTPQLPGMQRSKLSGPEDVPGWTRRPWRRIMRARRPRPRSPHDARQDVPSRLRDLASNEPGVHPRRRHLGADPRLPPQLRGWGGGIEICKGQLDHWTPALQ